MMELMVTMVIDDAQILRFFFFFTHSFAFAMESMAKNKNGNQVLHTSFTHPHYSITQNPGVTLILTEFSS